MVGIHRSTQCLTPPPVSVDELQLRELLRDFAKLRPRWGWRRDAKESRRLGRQVNDKRVRRLWRDAGLRVQHKRRNKRLSGDRLAVDRGGAPVYVRRHVDASLS